MKRESFMEDEMDARKKLRVLQGLSAMMVLLLVLAATAAFASQGELDDVNHAIHGRHGRWLAQETSISRLSDHDRRMRLGLMPPTGGNIQSSAALKGSSSTSSSVVALSVPASLDWRNYSGFNYVTPVRDQGNCGSCWAFATTAALESNVLLTTGNSTNLAEQILVSCSGAGNCNGGYIDRASSYIRDTGLPGENYFPYTATNSRCSRAVSGWRNYTSDISSWNWVTLTAPTVDAIKGALVTYGPLVTTMDVYADFYYYAGGVYSYSYGSYQGGHAILIVGYDDAGQYFIVKNSWGSGWGESGFFKIAYSELDSPVFFGDYTIAYYTETVAPSITVTSPNGGESWVAGTTHAITWSSTGSPGSSVKIDLYRNGSFESTVAASVSTAGGSYNWAIPSDQTPDTTYQVVVTSTSDSIYSDISNGVFSITAPAQPTITVTTPNGGESWKVNTTQTIRWTYNGSPGTYVKIELLKGNSVNRTITSRTSVGSGGAGSYNWRISSRQTIGTDYRVRVTSTSNSGYSDTSDNVFSLVR